MNLVPVWNEEANCNVVELPATLVRLADSADRELKNDNKTPFGVSIVDLDYGDGGEPEQVTAITWGTNLEMGTFDGYEGKQVKVRINFDGEYEGLTTLQLPGGRVNIDRLKAMVKASEPVKETV